MAKKDEDVYSIVESAETLFRDGRFEGAEHIYLRIVGDDPANAAALARLGHIALLANRLEDAQTWLLGSLGLNSDDMAKSLLAEVFYRGDRFVQAAPLFRAAGREALAKKLESFGSSTPYRIQTASEKTSLKFALTDPLPLVQLKVNESRPVHFLIDTGAAELVIDTEFAWEIGAELFGSQMGTYAGGKQGAFQHGRVESLDIGEFTVRNVPVHISDVRRFRLGSLEPHGIIGTVLLYHFLATMDYVKEELILRRKTEESLRRVEKEAEEHGAVVLPFWIAGDHYMVAWGSANKSEPMLFLVDTGLAGGGFTCPESTLTKAGIQLQHDLAREGLGGGGPVRAVPFRVDELKLGEAVEHDVQGFYLGGENEYRHGFHVGGIISHTFFRRYSLTFDFSKMRLFLASQKKA